MNKHEDNDTKNSESSKNVEASYPCDKCEQAFDSRRELKEHGRSAHHLL